jgi:hypothetical protein
MKKMAMVLVCVMLLSAFAIGSAAVAAVPPGWYNCTVTSVGIVPAGNYYFVVAQNPDGGWVGSQSFLIDSTTAAAKTLLATILTGYSGTGQVALFLPDGVGQFAFVQAVVAGAW